MSIDSYKCRPTVISVDRQLQVSIDSYKCRPTVISVDRQLFFSTVVSVDVQLLTVNGQLLTVQEKNKAVLLMALTSHRKRAYETRPVTIFQKRLTAA